VSAPGVSFLLPVHDGERHLEEVLAAIERQRDGRPFEIVAVDDRSRDGSRALLERAAAAGRLRLLDGPGRGAAAALNLAVKAARHPWLCQVDQDVVLAPEWLAAVAAAVDSPRVAAVQGHYVTASDASLWARIAGLDLEDRYARLRPPVEQAASGNTLYLASALREVGGFDEALGYGYDNDLSYRLRQAGHELRLRPDARAVHHWRPTLYGYLRQQYGVGYGRLDLVRKHPRRVAGDSTSGIGMILHAAAALAALGAGALAAASWALGRPWHGLAAAAVALVALLAFERAWAGLRAARRSGDAAGLFFPFAHALRDLAWALALAVWSARRLVRRPSCPADSMGGSLYSTDRRENR
jgi:succinoglycan biosynthesis protein ExoA